MIRDFDGWKLKDRHRTHSADFKRRIMHESLSVEMLQGLAKRPNISCNLIRIWNRKQDAAAFGDAIVIANVIGA